MTFVVSGALRVKQILWYRFCIEPVLVLCHGLYCSNADFSEISSLFWFLKAGSKFENVVSAANFCGESRQSENLRPI